MKVDVLDHGYVSLVETWGSDERIIEAARMSTNKGFLGWGPTHTPACTGYNAGTCDCPMNASGDEKLLKYLYENRHDTPFEMAGMIVEVQAPVFVFREWHRHRTQSYNEMSARYTEIPEVFYVPSRERMEKSAPSLTNKQGSEGPLAQDQVDEAQAIIQNAGRDAFKAYHILLKNGVAREVARLVLPVNTYSRMRASANLRNWLSFLTLRNAPNAQYEIRVYAEALQSMLSTAFPRTLALFAAGR